MQQTKLVNQKQQFKNDILFWGLPLSFAPAIIGYLVSDLFIDDQIISLLIGCLVAFSLFFVLELAIVFDKTNFFERITHKNRAQLDVILYTAKLTIFAFYGILSAFKIFTKMDEPLSATIYALGILVSFDRIISCIKEIKNVYEKMIS